MPRTTAARPIRSLVLDFDGTLVDSNEIKRAAFYQVTAGLDGAERVLDRVLGRPDSGDRYAIFEAVAGELDSEAVCPEELAREYGARCQEQILAALDEPGLKGLLERLRGAGYQAFIVSATPQRDLQALLGKTSLPACLDGVFGRPPSKPEIISDLLNKYRWSPLEVLVVGDGRDDREAAQALGCPFVAVASKGGTLRAPTRHRIGSVHELWPLMEEHPVLEPERVATANPR